MKITAKTIAATLALGASSVLAGAQPAHAQHTAALSGRVRAAFFSTYNASNRCRVDLNTVIDDTQYLIDNANAGTLDTGTLGPDARQMSTDCAQAAARIRAVHLPAGAGYAAHRYQMESAAGYQAAARGAAITVDVAADVDNLDVSAAQTDIASAERAFASCTAHLKIANSIF